MIVYKTEIFNNIKYELIETNNDLGSCLGCAFSVENTIYECNNKHQNNDCVRFGHNAIWQISKSYIRKQKLEKLKSL